MVLNCRKIRVKSPWPLQWFDEVDLDSKVIYRVQGQPLFIIQWQFIASVVKFREKQNLNKPKSGNNRHRYLTLGLDKGLSEAGGEVTMITIAAATRIGNELPALMMVGVLPHETVVQMSARLIVHVTTNLHLNTETDHKEDLIGIEAAAKN